MGKKKVEVSDSLEDLFGVEQSEDSLQNNPKTHGKDEKEEDSSLTPSSIQNPSTPIQLTYHRSLNIPELSNEELIECPPKIDTVFITRKAFDDIIMVAKAINEISKGQWGVNSQMLEVFCYVLADESQIKAEVPACISEIYIPRHSAAETAVNVSTDAVLEVSEYLKKNKKVLLGWAHSHGHFDVYSSKTDEQNHQILLNDTANLLTRGHFRIKYIYGITVVEGGEHLGIILSQYPCGHVGRAEDSTFEIQGKGYTDREKEERFIEIKEILEDRVQITKPSLQSSRDDSLQDISDEFVEEYIRNLRKAKNLLYDKLPETMDKHFELFQRVLQEYDSLLMSTAEESFTKVSEKLLTAMKQYKDSH